MNVYKKKSDLKTELSSFSVRGNLRERDISEKGLSNAQRQITDEHLGEYIVFKIKGDSMEKLIMDGSKVIIDTSDREIVSGGIYALNIPWEGTVVRECYIEPGGVVLMTYNKNYPEVVLSWEEFEPEIIIGKVFCSILNVFR